MAEIKQFEDLPVWQVARELVKDIYALTRTALFKKDFRLCQQIQSAAVSVTSNIAEGFERGSREELIQFLYIARGSAGEARSQLYNASDIGYISKEAFKKGIEACFQISRQIASFIDYLKDSCFKGDKFGKPIAKNYAVRAL